MVARRCPCLCLKIPAVLVLSVATTRSVLGGGGGGAVSQSNPMTAAVSQVRTHAHARRRDKVDTVKMLLESIRLALSDTQQELGALAGEKGISSWITISPSFKQPVAIFSKSDFCDAVAIRYGYPLDGLPTTCV